MKIYLESEENALERINNRDVTICIIGVGTIGLPLATFFANSGFKVIGLDVNKRRVDQVNKTKVVFEYSRLLKKVITQKKLVATTNPERSIKRSDVIFLCVPTPIDEKKNIDLSYVISSTNNIIKNIEKGMIIVVESSVKIGTTRYVGELIEKNTGLKMGTDFGVAHCPERYNPTLPMEWHPEIIYDTENHDHVFTFDKISRVVGAVDKKSLVIVKNLYSQIIKEKIYEASSIEEAEATKLTENIFRDVNIALVNELSKVFPKFGLDVFKIIDAAKTKSFAFLPHYPGVGVGGECIPVDTWYLIKQAESVGVETKLLKTVREINDSMPQQIVLLLGEALGEAGKKINESKITVLGLAYKKNIADTRSSPTYKITELLKNIGSNVQICDPLVEKINGSSNLISLEKAFNDVDAVIIAVDHDIFRNIKLKEMKNKMRIPIIIDGRNFYDKNLVKSLGFIYRAVGKPSD